MKIKFCVLVSFSMLISFTGFSQKNDLKLKQAILKSVENHQQELIKLSDEIWGFAETALK
ncbi:MAG: amidohydrolase, partial [Flavobacteriales bacterium CG03_land_8_20_14_0_80_35_15]